MRRPNIRLPARLPRSRSKWRVRAKQRQGARAQTSLTADGMIPGRRIWRRREGREAPDFDALPAAEWQDDAGSKPKDVHALIFNEYAQIVRTQTDADPGVRHQVYASPNLENAIRFGILFAAALKAGTNTAAQDVRKRHNSLIYPAADAHAS